ncbi:HAMP domain-containing histidine kinase [Candidatus Woesearchaeota archaeon]|nr:HAMP domain-containing histidine kinase [Candidatus Woesearchaeota archaeon]
MKIRTKLLIGAIFIISLMGTTAIASSYLLFEKENKREIEREGTALSLSLARETSDLLIRNDPRAQTALQDAYSAQPLIEYITILSSDRRVLSHIGAPPAIPQEVKFTPSGASIAETTTPDKTIYEFTQPLTYGNGILRIGISDEHLQKTRRQNLSLVILLALACSTISLFCVMSLTKRITAPLQELHSAAHSLSLGNFNAHANISTKDELQELADVFNKTTQVLSKIDDERKQIDSAKTRFLSITSHELRSPMTPMKAQLQMLEEGYFGKLSQKQLESVSMVIRNADRLDKIIADFLEISRIEAARLKFEFKKADLAQVAKETIEYMKGFMPEKKITLEADIGKLPIIETDPDRVSQVLRNLISNAIKFSPQNGTITIKALLHQDHLLFSVQDHGVGISQKDQLKLFEPFFQAEQTIYREGKGVGLGLAISRGIVLSQNGKIWVESQTGQGATFYFTLPLEPVKDIKPIKVLFSAKETIERKLAELFEELLGPIGKTEFEELKETALVKEKIEAYISDLERRKILDKEKAGIFRNNAAAIFYTNTQHFAKN